MTGPEGPEPARPRMYVVAAVWGGAGVIALVIALIASTPVVAVFGGLALLAGCGLYAAQRARMRSARETQQVMSPPTDPPPGPADDVPDREIDREIPDRETRDGDPA